MNYLIYQILVHNKHLFKLEKVKAIKYKLLTINLLSLDIT